MNWIKANPEKSLLGLLLVVAAGILIKAALALQPVEPVNLGPASGSKAGADVDSFKTLAASLTSSPEWKEAEGENQHEVFFSRRIEWDPKKQVIAVYRQDAEGADGVPRAWKKRWGFPENIRFGSSDDSDGDGFTNVEEHRAFADGLGDFNPKDAQSHPDYLLKLKLSEFGKVPFRVEFRSYVDEAGKMICSLQLKDAPALDKRGAIRAPMSTIKVSPGDVIQASGKETPWVVGELRVKTGTRLNPKTSLEQPFDESELDVKNKITGEKLTLVYRKETDAAATMGTLVFLKDNSKISVSLGRDFTFDGREFRVKALSAAGAVVTLLPDAKKEFTLAPENGTQAGPLSIQPAAAAPAAAPARPAAAVPAPAAVNPPLPQP